MNCPFCGAPLRPTAGQDSLTCDYCGTIHFSTPDSGVVALEPACNLVCPVCAVPLFNAVMSTIPVCYCRKCRGILIEMSRFLPLMQAIPPATAPQPIDVTELSRKINCPRCHRTMETHVYYGGGHVIIDDCSACELKWLDFGEAARIAAAFCQEEST